MSARKLHSSVASPSKHLTLEGRQTRLELPPESVKIHPNGIEFFSTSSFPLWAEMTLALECPREGKVNCSGVVVSCQGSRHAGYRVSLVFTGLSRQAQARLNALAYS